MGRFADFDLVGEGDEPLGGVGAAVEQNVLHFLAQILGNFLVDAEHARIDDRHVHAGANRMVEKGGVHRLPHRVVAAKRKRDV